MREFSKILREMGPIFDPTEDYLNIVAAEEQMSGVAASRQKEVDHVQAEMKGSFAPHAIVND